MNFKKSVVFLVIFFFFYLYANGAVFVVLHTDYGNIKIKLFKKEAPVTVANFLRYVKSGRYNNMFFHRIVKKFVIQGGKYRLENGKVKKIKEYGKIKNEKGNGFYNVKKMVAMAHFDGKPNSASSQFFINLRNNVSLSDYAVFGRVVAGWNVVKKIAQLEVDKKAYPKKKILVKRWDIIDNN